MYLVVGIQKMYFENIYSELKYNYYNVYDALNYFCKIYKLTVYV
jgi:hypothetical protein